jgi:hypothetical protein
MFIYSSLSTTVQLKFNARLKLRSINYDFAPYTLTPHFARIHTLRFRKFPGPPLQYKYLTRTRQLIGKMFRQPVKLFEPCGRIFEELKRQKGAASIRVFMQRMEQLPSECLCKERHFKTTKLLLGGGGKGA